MTSGDGGETRVRGGRYVVVAIAVIIACGALVWSGSADIRSRAPSAVLRVDTGAPGNLFAPGAVGLSTETAELGSGRLNSSHVALVRLMRLLGPSVLRVGGNSVDRSWWTSTGEQAPQWATNTVVPSDLEALRVLLDRTGWRVILGVDLSHFEPGRVANEARVAQDALGGDLLGVEIGNEPDSFGSSEEKQRATSYNVSDYLHEVEVYRQALTAAVPGLALYGPATVKTHWLTEMSASAGVFKELTQHYYPAPNGTCSGGAPSSAVVSPTAAELLSVAVREQEATTLEALSRAGAVVGRPTRIGETGTGACLGNSSASPEFASALWSLDWSLRAADSGVEGLNFHGHLGFCGVDNQSPVCAASLDAARSRDVTAQPEYYGLLAASRLEGGRFVPVSMASATPLSNLSTWATVYSNGVVRIAIDDLAIGGTAQAIAIPMAGYTATEEILTASSVAARAGVTFGHASVQHDGEWHPGRERVTWLRSAFQVAVQPSSALVITLSPDTH